jgi:hypothetical protein
MNPLDQAGQFYYWIISNPSFEDSDRRERFDTIFSVVEGKLDLAEF